MFLLLLGSVKIKSLVLSAMEESKGFSFIILRTKSCLALLIGEGTNSKALILLVSALWVVFGYDEKTAFFSWINKKKFISLQRITRKVSLWQNILTLKRI